MNIKAIIASSLALGSIASAQGAMAQSFDCGVVRYAAETAVCHNALLAELDERVDRIYSALHLQAGNRREREELRDYQLQFLSARNACGGNVSCVKGAYLDQIEVLSSQLRHASNN